MIDSLIVVAYAVGVFAIMPTLILAAWAKRNWFSGNRTEANSSLEVSAVDQGWSW